MTGEGNGSESRQKSLEEKREEKLDLFKLKEGQLGLGLGNNVTRNTRPNLSKVKQISRTKDPLGLKKGQGPRKVQIENIGVEFPTKGAKIEIGAKKGMCKNEIRALNISETIIDSIMEEGTKRRAEILLAELDPNQEYEKRRNLTRRQSFWGRLRHNNWDRWWLLYNPVGINEFFKLELSRVWEPLDSSGP